ncbi:hypothetical protein HYPSUDRAFT_204912 [Hypholoma sublateritium FD-334 SS-4]|uniref:Trichothecene 3-O-acetyltransferase-like N-terminal domain-containing protein n=1 Tax=Hypholoma sublateritium (strain FD-334 SS-4) TaxID=945553 RepID=A0A0D2PFV2_HYPSF|nr:hypothetical protein HYPSUDRAFT_204912 [Hypholoma sublateritium FD-334 SS-4]
MLNDILEVFGQQPALSNLYTQITCCFPVRDSSSSHSEIIGTLMHGLEQLSAKIPWVAGQVINEGAGPGNTGTFKIVPLEKTPRLVVKDLQNDPSIAMDTLRRARFPFIMLDENIIAPIRTLSSGSDDTSPVFLIQATFIPGGLLLTFVGQHNVMDMTGQGRIINLFSKACHNVEFSSEEMESGNPDRHTIIPLLGPSFEPGPELNRQMARPTVSEPADFKPPLTLPKCSWAYFTFSQTALAEIKTVASATLPTSVNYISTDDALSAFIWKSIVQARLPRLIPATPVTFARAIDPRCYLGISPTYPGLVQNMTYHTYPARELIDAPLSEIASHLRLAVDPKTSDLEYRTRALATFLDRSPDKSGISVTATMDLSADIMLSSWAKENFYDLDFNLGLGKPEAVRRPQFTPVESLLYLMPKRLDGEISAAICLRDEDMGRLRGDEHFIKYAAYIG